LSLAGFSTDTCCTEVKILSGAKFVSKRGKKLSKKTLLFCFCESTKPKKWEEDGGSNRGITDCDSQAAGEGDRGDALKEILFASQFDVSFYSTPKKQ